VATPAGGSIGLTQPYNAGYGALGLIDAATILENADSGIGASLYAQDIASYLGGAYHWMQWYSAQMAANAPSSPEALAACNLTDVLLGEGPSTTISCYYVPTSCVNVPAGVTLQPYGSGDPRYCTGISGTNDVPVEFPQSGLYAPHLYTDSTDSTAAMFLVVARAWYVEAKQVDSGDATPLSELESLVTPPGDPSGDVINEAITAIHSTLDTTAGQMDSSLGATFTTAGDDLTWATPWWEPSWPYPHKYLEDEAETAAGLDAAAALEDDPSILTSRLSDLSSSERVALARSSAAIAQRISTTFNTTLWGTAPGQSEPGFGWSKDENGIVTFTNWSNSITADPQQDMWAVMWGLATPAHAATILSSFNLTYGPGVASASSLWAAPSTSGSLPPPLYWVAVTEEAGGALVGSTTGVKDEAVGASVSVDEDAIYANDRYWQYEMTDAGLALWAELRGADPALNPIPVGLPPAAGRSTRTTHRRTLRER
jgi:hypothetical protein